MKSALIGALRSEGYSRAGVLSKYSWRALQLSQNNCLYFLSIEMWSVLCKKNISRKEHPHRDLSTALRSGRDDKGEGGCCQGE
jgi:hypothetical protein